MVVVLLLGSLAGCGRTPPDFVERAPLKGHNREITSIAFAPNGRSLASRAAGEIRIWDLKQAGPTHQFPALDANFGSVVYSPNGRWLASETTNSVKFWDTLDPENQSEPLQPSMFLGIGAASKGWGLAFSPDGRYLVRGNARDETEGYLTLWNFLKVTPSSNLPIDSPTLPRPLTTVAFSPDSQSIASGSMDGKIAFWQADAVPLIPRLTIEAKRSYLAPVLFSPDGRFVVSADESRWVRFWDASTGKSAAIYKGHIKAVLSIAFHPNGQTMVSGDSGGTIFVWDVPSRKMLTRLEPKDHGKIWALAFSPDGKILASAGEDNLIHLWDVSGDLPLR